MLAWHQFHQVSLDLFRIGVASQSEPLRESDDVGVNHDALIFFKRVAQDHIRGLPPNARQFPELSHRFRHTPFVFRDEHRGRCANALRFVPKEARGTNCVLQLARPGIRIRSCAAIFRKERRGDEIHALIRALGGKNCRDQQLQRIPKIQFATRTGIDLR